MILNPVIQGGGTEKEYKSPSRAFLFCYACIRCYRRVTSRNEVAA